MAELLLEVNEKLKIIKENLVKLNQSRRVKTVVKPKLEEANIIYTEFNSRNELIEEKIKNNEIKGTDLVIINKLILAIKTTYSQIVEFCNKYIETESTMAAFDLKTAVGLLPVMTGEEEVTKKLISSIELYETMLDAATKPQLIQFVLKTRLTESAKLRLSTTYASCEELVKDMRKHLLTTKSSISIHSQLMRATQSSSSVDEFGKKIEELFVDLTITQADGNDSSYSVLKPINEKLAIKRFTDGLRNRQLSVILAARNYTTLKDVIRAAKDEEQSTTLREGEVAIYSGRRGNYSRYSHSRSFAGRSRGGGYNQRLPPNHGGQRPLPQPPVRGYANQNRGYRGAFRGRGFANPNNSHSNWNRGRSNNSNYSRQNTNRAYFMNTETPSTLSQNDDNRNSNQFFRS